MTTALYKPLAIRSISSSICCSDEEGELSIVYEEWGIVLGWTAGGLLVVEGAWEGGRRENSDGEGAMNDRYWSST